MLIGALDDVGNAVHWVGVKQAILLGKVKNRENKCNLSIHSCHATIILMIPNFEYFCQNRQNLCLKNFGKYIFIVPIQSV